MAKKYSSIQKEIIDLLETQLEIAKRPLMIRVKKVVFKNNEYISVRSPFREFSSDMNDDALLGFAEAQIEKSKVKLKPFSQFLIDITPTEIHLLTYNENRKLVQTIVIVWVDKFFDMDDIVF